MTRALYFYLVFVQDVKSCWVGLEDYFIQATFGKQYSLRTGTRKRNF